jgi:hypothetical protein
MAFRRRIRVRRPLADRVGAAFVPVTGVSPPSSLRQRAARPPMRRSLPLLGCGGQAFGATVGSDDEQGVRHLLLPRPTEDRGVCHLLLAPLGHPRAAPAFRRCGRRGSLHPWRRPSHRRRRDLWDDVAATGDGTHLLAHVSDLLPCASPPWLLLPCATAPPRLLPLRAWRLGRRARARRGVWRSFGTFPTNSAQTDERNHGIPPAVRRCGKKRYPRTVGRVPFGVQYSGADSLRPGFDGVFWSGQGRFIDGQMGHTT